MQECPNLQSGSFNMQKFHIYSMLALSIFLVGCGTADNTTPQAKDGEISQEATENLTRLLSDVTQGQGRLEKTFEGPDGLIGIVGKEDNGDRFIVWASPNGKILLPSVAIDSDGNNLNETMRMSAGLDDAKTHSLTMASHPNTKSILQGQSGPIVTVFIDPNCIHCHHLFKEVQAPIAEGRLRVRYILTGFLNESSKGIAAAILASEDPLSSLIEAETNYDEKLNQAGLAPLSNIPEDIENTLVKNVEVLNASVGRVSTPALIYCKSDGSGVEAILGAPANMADFLNEVGEEGHLSCKQ